MGKNLDGSMGDEASESLHFSPPRQQIIEVGCQSKVEL
uniref:Uncharacterized protein n=1 Tax=Arundo donax TaxID=35708 RepID=A0A0A9G3U7_ARUDO